MTNAFDLTPDFSRQFGVTYLSRLRDGAGVTGRVRRIARRLGLTQDRADEELFRADGGRAAVESRLMSKVRDAACALTGLTAAEDRLLLIHSLSTLRTPAISIDRVSELVGYGVFSNGLIRARDVIGEYAGVLRAPIPEDIHNHYLAQTPAYGPIGGLVIDGRDEGNHTRFINHCHRAPNVSNHFVFHERRWRRVLRADRDIRPGEQLLWDYGADYWRAREVPAEL